MRIKAKIEISNRTLAVHNMSGRKGKDAQASLAIGRKPKSVQSTLKDSNQQVILLQEQLLSIVYLNCRHIMASENQNRLNVFVEFTGRRSKERC